MIDPLLALVSMVASLYAVACLWSRALRRDLASPTSLYATLMLAHFTIPGLLYGVGVAPQFVNRANEPYAVPAVVFAIAGLMAMQLGVSMAGGRGAGSKEHSRIEETSRVWSSSRVVWIVAALLMVGWAARIHIVESNAYFQATRTAQGELEGPFYAAIRLMEQLPLHALCVISIRYWRPGFPATASWKYALVLVMLAELAYWLPSGRKLETILALLLPLVIRYLRTRQLPSKLLALSFMAFVALLFPLAYQYRAVLEVGEHVSQAAEVAKAAADAVARGSGVDVSTSDIVLGRLSLLEPLSACIRLLGQRDWEPMLGTSYGLALLGLVPRFLWPGKPDLHYGTDFGHAAGLLSSGDWLTSISVTFPGEAYLNFGWGGLLPILAMGLLFGAIYRQARFAEHRETWLLLYVLMLPTILYIGGTAALHFGGLIKVLPFYYVLGHLMTWPHNRAPSGGTTSRPPSLARPNDTRA